MGRKKAPSAVVRVEHQGKYIVLGIRFVDGLNALAALTPTDAKALAATLEKAADTTLQRIAQTGG